jgi:hypothetical protein
MPLDAAASDEAQRSPNFSGSLAEVPGDAHSRTNPGVLSWSHCECRLCQVWLADLSVPIAVCRPAQRLQNNVSRVIGKGTALQGIRTRRCILGRKERIRLLWKCPAC